MIPLGHKQQSAELPAVQYLSRVLARLPGGSDRWRCEVVVSGSVPEGIADFAAQEKVDLIAMYSHDRRGLAKLVRGNIAEGVRQRSATELRVLRPNDLASIGIQPQPTREGS
ncbi:MAG: universal stress protein [Dehalococcoidia bacterium]